MNRIRKCIALLCAAAVVASALPASALETVNGLGYIIRNSRIMLGENLALNETTLRHATVGNEEERYFELTPGGDIIPFVNYGDSIYGVQTMSSAITKLREKSVELVGGINGDFFMLDTGVPIGLVISSGTLRSSDAGQNAIGFNNDGSVFIGKPSMSIKLTTSAGASVNIDYLNKARKEYGTYLMSSDFAATSKTTSEGKNIVLSSVSAPLKLGSSVTAKVEKITSGTISPALTAGKLLLTVDKKGPLSTFDDIQEGMDVTIEFSTKDARFSGAFYAIGAGDRLVTGGIAESGLSTARAPRTAVGVRADGTSVFYTVDGRREGWSGGLSLVDLAQRLVTLGCVDAVNLDGGGSTSASAKYPGRDTDLSIIDKPSDNAQRKCSNFIFFSHTKKKTGKPKNLHFYPYDVVMLSGASQKFDIYATDDYYFNSSYPGGTSVTVSDTSIGEYKNSSFVSAKGSSGTVTLEATSAEAAGAVPVKVVSTPSEISVLNQKTKQILSSLTLSNGESIDLTATAFFDGRELISSDECFTWTLSGTAGTINEAGLLTASPVPGASGTLMVSAGDKQVTIPVTAGSPPGLIESFEGNSTIFAAGASELAFVQVSGEANVKYGFRAGSLSYDVSGTTDALMLKAPVSVQFASAPVNIGMWVKGDGSGNMFGGIASDASGKDTEFSICRLDFTDYRYIVAALPAATASLKDFTLTRDQSSVLSKGMFYLDQIVTVQDKKADLTPPTITFLSSDLTTEEGYANITASVLDDNGASLDKTYISLTLDGSPAEFGYDIQTGLVTLRFPILPDSSTHRITAVASDTSGNVARASTDISTRGETTIYNFVDLTGHWSQEYAEYLYGRKMMTGTNYPDGRKFFPERDMTRAEFAVVMTNFLKADRSVYGNASLPFEDKAKIPSWAMAEISCMYSLGIIQGKNSYGHLIFDPDAPITRAEVMTILGRTLPKGYTKAAMSFADAADIPNYAGDYVGTLVGLGVVTGYNDNTIKAGGNVKRSEAAVMIYRMF